MSPSADVCVAGELLWDHHADDVLEHAQRFVRVIGGAAANVAVALRDHHGVDVAVAGAVGDDALGRGLRDALAAKTIDTSALLLRRGQTGSVFIEPFRNGGQRFYSYRPSVTWPARPKLPWGRGSLAGRWLHVAALNPDELDVMSRLAERVVSRGGSVSIDVNARPRPWRGVKMTRKLRRVLRDLVRCASWVKSSSEDLSVLGLKELPEAQTLIVTRGPRTMSLRTPFGNARLRPVKADVSWSIGAGDAFTARIVAHVANARVPKTLAEWKRVVRLASSDAAQHLQRAAPK